jgi:hypothetical protein
MVTFTLSLVTPSVSANSVKLNEVNKYDNKPIRARVGAVQNVIEG